MKSPCRDTAHRWPVPRPPGTTVKFSPLLFLLNNRAGPAVVLQLLERRVLRGLGTRQRERRVKEKPLRVTRGDPNSPGAQVGGVVSPSPSPLNDPEFADTCHVSGTEADRGCHVCTEPCAPRLSTWAGPRLPGVHWPCGRPIQHLGGVSCRWSPFSLRVFVEEAAACG